MMVKKYNRYCDGCKKEIESMYDFGVTTLYQRIRIGRGNRFHDYEEGSKYNGVNNEAPDDYDHYGSGWSSDENKEFSFCSPECLLKFFEKLYKDTYNNSLKVLKEEENELNITIKDFKKKYGERIPFFQKIQTVFSKGMFRDSALEDVDKLLKNIKRVKKELLKDVKGENEK